MANSFSPSYWLYNGELQSGSPAGISAQQTVYEVLRVIDGIPLFWEDHHYRLIESGKHAVFDIQITKNQFAEKLKLLIHSNHVTVGNIKIDVGFDGKRCESAFYLISHRYPSPEEYRNGVEAIMLEAERKNPKAKIHQPGLREKANQMIEKTGVYDVILVDGEQQITEGSRTNVFFLKDGCFITSMEDQVLSGVTRRQVIHCIGEMGEELVERPIDVNEVGEMEAAFFSGTSPKILPICKIGKHLFESQNDQLVKLIQTFDHFITNYIQENRAYFGS